MAIKKNDKVKLRADFRLGNLMLLKGDEGKVLNTLREGFAKKCKVQFGYGDITLPEKLLEKI